MTFKNYAKTNMNIIGEKNQNGMRNHFVYKQSTVILQDLTDTYFKGDFNMLLAQNQKTLPQINKEVLAV